MSGYGYGICPCHACTCTAPVCRECGVGVEEPQQTYACPDCNAPAGAECDETCPSAMAAYVEAFEVDMEEWEHLTPEELRAARERLSRWAA